MALNTHDFPTPVQLGLPSRFTAWRPGQLEAILTALDSERRCVGEVLATGSGKSIVYMTIAAITGGRAAILTRTRSLQAQLARDFNQVAVIQGQRAYLCRAVAPGGELATAWAPIHTQHDTTVDQGPCHVGVTCLRKTEGGCDYYDAVRAGLHAPLLLTNYAWWLTVPDQPHLRVDPGLLILDEAHEAPDALSDALGADLSAKDVAETLSETLPSSGQREPQEWITWAGAHADRLATVLEGTAARSPEAARRLRRSQHLLRALRRVSHMDAHLLVVTDTFEGVRCHVVWAAPYAESHLFRGARKIILTSATFTKYTADLLGLAPNDLHIYDPGEGFDPKRRPVYWVPTVRVEHRWSDLDRRTWLTRIDQICRGRQDRKGLIHTVSYARRDWLMAHSEFGARMISHDSRNMEQQLALFRRSGPGAIFVSPSITTGYDFPYQDAEFQIVSKLPFPDSRDPIVAARKMIDKVYPMHVTMQTLVQMVGRPMRAPDDQAETFIIDDHASWFVSKHANLAPKWFRQAYARVTVIPAPPPPLSPRSRSGPTEESGL